MLLILQGVEVFSLQATSLLQQVYPESLTRLNNSVVFRQLSNIPKVQILNLLPLVILRVSERFAEVLRHSSPPGAVDIEASPLSTLYNQHKIQQGAW
jgi:hypothetical protein